jgi:hypothetical protein
MLAFSVLLAAGYGGSWLEPDAPPLWVFIVTALGVALFVIAVNWNRK